MKTLNEEMIFSSALLVNRP